MHLRSFIAKSNVSSGILIGRLFKKHWVKLVLLGLLCGVLLPTSRAVTPPPDGGYTGENTAEGEDALFSLTTGQRNTAVGNRALYHLTTGSDSTAVGNFALNQIISSTDNTAVGSQSLSSTTTGFNNTAVGAVTLVDNTSGKDNTAIGSFALDFNITGSDNTAAGYNALTQNVRGLDNTAVGVSALAGNKDSSFSTATGYRALFVSTASNNTADGFEALVSNTTGTQNTATGGATLFDTTTGDNNTADGFEALFANTTGNNNVAVGALAGSNLTKGSNNIDIGNAGKAGEANVIRIGTQGTQKSAFIAGVSGVAVSGSTVVVNSVGKLGVATSSARFKEQIKSMSDTSVAILKLKPVTFRYKKEVDPEATPQFGLVAEDVEKVDPQLVVHDEEGEPYTVRYEAVNAMLLNEFLKEHRTVEELKATVAQQQKHIETLTATVLKVSDQLQLNEPAPQVPANNH
jgi:hypothetical protein